MSFEDIEVAWATCAAKEVIKDKGKRGQKRKSTIIEADNLELDAEPDSEPDLEPEVARATEEVINGRRKRGWKRKSSALEVDEPEPEVALYTPVPWTALVARMIWDYCTKE
jgi:hypothetical protein